MKHPLLLLLLLLPTPGAPSRHSQIDSLRTVITSSQGEEKLSASYRLSTIYYPEVRRGNVIDTLFAIYDDMEAEAIRTGSIYYQSLVRVSRMGALSNKRLYDELIAQAPACIDFLLANHSWMPYYRTMALLADAHTRKGNTAQALHELETALDHANRRNDAAGKGTVLFAISKLYANQKRHADAETCLKECIELLKDSTNYWGLQADAYHQLTLNYIALKRYDDALQTATKYEKANRLYDERTQTANPGTWVNLWLSYIDLYRQTERYDLAETYIHKIDSATQNSITLYEERAHIYLGKKEYRKALEMIDREIAFRPGRLQPKGVKMMTLIEMGDAPNAQILFGEIIAHLDSIRNAQYNARLDEVRTRYEVDKHIAEKQRNRNYFLFALTACALLLVLLGGAFYYNRIIAQKNRNLYLKIKERDRQQEEPPGSKTQRDLVNRLHEYLLHDDNLTQTDIDRNDLITALGTNKNLLTEAVKCVTGKTLMEYIRFMQLEEARRMMDRHPELTIETIAQETGFAARNTFYSLFRKNYGITPSEYRTLSNH